LSNRAPPVISHDEHHRLADLEALTLPSTARQAKFRQAAFVYLHVTLLYEYAAYAMWRAGLLPTTRFAGPAWIWLIIGLAVGFAVFLALLRWQNAWFARVIWVFHGLRLPSLIHGAFFQTEHGAYPSSFYLTAIVVVTINLWMLARAAWDL
jgi:hypothetical protein